jgi:IS1 family transposase
VIDMDTRLRLGCAVTKTESDGALLLMRRLKQAHPEAPPALATDARGGYEEAMVETWGEVPAYQGWGRPRTRKQAGPDWKYLQVKKIRSGNRLLEVQTKVIFGEAQQVVEVLGEHTAYIERSQLTSRQMNGRVVRKTLSFSKKVRCLQVSCTWEDAVYNWTRRHRSLRVQSSTPGRRWDQRSPAMAAGLTDHIWSVRELLTTVVVPKAINSA